MYIMSEAEGLLPRAEAPAEQQVLLGSPLDMERTPNSTFSVYITRLFTHCAHYTRVR